jgi:hypothetical protein
MSLTPDEAATSLKEIERAGRRSALAYSYASASPHLIMWGILWMIGYGVSDLNYRIGGLFWIVLTLCGLLASIFIGRQQTADGHAQPGRSGTSLKFAATFFAIGLFITAAYAIFGHTGVRQQAAFVPLIVALIYSVLGIWKGPRFLVMGMLIAALTLGGFFFLKEHFLLWMAMVGGGALVLGGLWLRAV